MLMNHLTFAPYDSRRDIDIGQLFRDYPYKDHQLRFMGVSKERMVKYLEKSLSKPDMQTICMRDKGRLVGLIALQSLPWISNHFGLRMVTVPHFLARSTGLLIHARLLRYVIEELQDVDFLDCRVPIDDIYACHALEICDFHYVSTEIYMGQVLKSIIPPEPHLDYEIRPCTPEERDQVVQIAGETQVHNRFVHDPIIHEDAAKSLYQRLVTDCFENNQFNVLVAHSRGRVEGFIITKMNLPFSQEVGQLCVSLDLIGVRPESRNRGLGVELIRWALYHLAEEKAVFVAVRTLANNYPALSICFHTGFQITSTSLHFHKWVRRPALYYKESPSYTNDRILNIQP
jgi:GNAT superfamily N-acetyltransferase